MDHQSAWAAQRPIEPKFLSSQPSILTIVPGTTQSSSRRISYPGWRMPAPVRVSQNGYTSAIPFRLPTVLDPLATLAITPSHPDPTMLELDSGGGQQASSRRNIATGLERSILATALIRCGTGRSLSISWGPNYPDRRSGHMLKQGPDPIMLS